MIRALLAVVLLAPLCGAMGVHVVNFRMAFFSDAISHSAFTGVVLGYMLVPVFDRLWPGAAHWEVFLPTVTLVVFGVLVGLGITAVRRWTELSADTVIGVFFATVIAAGIALIYGYGRQRNFEQYLYGSVLTVTNADVWLTLLLAAVVAAFHALTFNHLTLIGLNESLARSRGIRVGLLSNAYALLLALVVTMSIRTVGLLLVTAMLVVPAATARNLARNAAGMFWWSIVIGLASGVTGLLLSYRLETSAGAMIILTASAGFFASLVATRISRRRG